MADFETAARPYARAVFEMAQDEGKLEQWQDFLSAASAITADANMQALLEQPALVASELVDLFLSVVAGTGIDTDADFDNLIKLLAENGRLLALPAITAVFETLKQDAEGKIEVQIRSAQALSDEQQENISKSLTQRLGKEVSITTEIDDSLIAGAIVTAGDLVIDGSASGRMQKLTLAVNK